MGVRKNQKNMTAAEWSKFIAAIDALHGAGVAAPAYRSFVNLHVAAMDMANMGWSVHTMSMGSTMMVGRNFLAWHRRFTKLMEERLQKINPLVTIPYWDSITDRTIPAAMNTPALLSRWSVTRNWDPSELATATDLTTIQNFSGTFSLFQSTLEVGVHNGTHRAVGGNMATASSPADPIFWLHHAFIDKLWADWQASPNGRNPPSPTRKLQPPEIVPGVTFEARISSVLDIASLGYSYA